jgi:hypothetical protein
LKSLPVPQLQAPNSIDIILSLELSVKENVSAKQWSENETSEMNLSVFLLSSLPFLRPVTLCDAI